MTSAWLRNPFGEFISMLSLEELASWKARCKTAGNGWLAQIFDDEYCERQLPIVYPEFTNSIGH